MTIILIAVGLVLLTLGGEILVRGSVRTAEAFGVSPLLIGLTLVGFGTSTPELVTSVMAAFRDAPGIAIGNVVGSNTANILLILGVTAMMAPLAVRPKAFRRDAFVLAASTVACVAAVMAGELQRWMGFALIAGLGAYMVFAYLNERTNPAEAGGESPAPRQPLRAVLPHVLLAVGGIVLTIFGARLLVDGAIVLAESLGVSDTVIGLTIVAVGTSLPELVACVIAAWRGHSDVALGNVIGSNIYNTLGILGVTAAIRPVTVPPEVAAFDIWILAAATALLLVFLRTRWRLERWESGVLMVGYCSYIAYLVAGA
ncbi:calcium/sodium antiporter [Consotaella salsifontis]|uniref:calcium/sodium antiporter n=1 Tax=Consotaella salsifontis TaxID=1365950 RepID=UPI0013F5BB5E|nr:calcium/sodium antiporter [Consotaella salsifontis]